MNDLQAVNTAQAQPKQSAFIYEIVSFAKSLAVLLIIAFLLQATVVQAFKIPSSSMEPTLEVGDHILVSKLSYGLRLPLLTESVYLWKQPQRGDIVVFTRPDDPLTAEDDSDINIIKRVIGLPGDTIDVRGTEIFVNNIKLTEPYSQWLSGGARDFGPVVIPEGRVLLLGDNRDASKDSRYWSDPFLEITRIKGRAFMIYWNKRLRFHRLFNMLK